MTDAPLTPEEALEENDITLALTPGQLLVAIVAIWLIVRFIRGLRG
jgi:hypothetical protein